MNSDSGRQKQQSASRPAATHTPTGMRLQPASAKDQDLVEISHSFQVLKKYEAQEPSAAQWRDFSRQLNAKLEYEAEHGGLGQWVQTVRDKWIATDSLALRSLGYVVMFMLLVVAALMLWFGATFTMSLFDGPAYALAETAVGFLA